MVAIVGPARNSVIMETLTELDNYLVSYNYRYIPSRTRVRDFADANLYAGSSGLRNLMRRGARSLLYDAAGDIGIYLERPVDEQSATIVIVHPDDRVEFRYYERSH